VKTGTFLGRNGPKLTRSGRSAGLCTPKSQLFCADRRVSHDLETQFFLGFAHFECFGFSWLLNQDPTDIDDLPRTTNNEQRTNTRGRQPAILAAGFLDDCKGRHVAKCLS